MEKIIVILSIVTVFLTLSIFQNKPKGSDYYIVIMQKFGNVKEYRKLSTQFTNHFLILLNTTTLCFYPSMLF